MLARASARAFDTRVAERNTSIHEHRCSRGVRHNSLCLASCGTCDLDRGTSSIARHSRASMRQPPRRRRRQQTIRLLNVNATNVGHQSATGPHWRAGSHTGVNVREQPMSVRRFAARPSSHASAGVRRPRPGLRRPVRSDYGSEAGWSKNNLLRQRCSAELRAARRRHWRHHHLCFLHHLRCRPPVHRPLPGHLHLHCRPRRPLLHPPRRRVRRRLAR